MAIVVLIGGIMLTMSLKTWIAKLNNSAYAETASKQAQIKIALIGFLRTNGRLPCPSAMSTAVPPVPTGLEILGLPAGRGCINNPYGEIPWASLGVSKDIAQDGWGNFFTYRVATAATAIVPAPVTVPVPPMPKNLNQNWTSLAASANAFDITSLVSSATSNRQTIQIDQGDGVDALVPITYNAVVVILSSGKNGFGALTLQGVRNTAPPVAPVNHADETTNATPGTLVFIMRPYTELSTAFGGPFDDVVAFMSPQDLLQPLVSEGTLGACRSYCAAAAAPVLSVTATCTPPGGGICTCASLGVPGTPTPSSCTNNATPSSCSICAVVSSPPASCTPTNVPIGNPAPNCP